MDSCSIGKKCGNPEDCHKTTYCRATYGLKNVSELSDNERFLLLRRCNLTDADATTTVCCHHEKVFLDKYSHLQKNCCDPFSLHLNQPKSTSLQEITVQCADTITLITGNRVHPGQKICRRCREELETCRRRQEEFETGKSSSSESEEMDISSLDAETAEDAQVLKSFTEATATSVDQSLQDAGFSPLKGKKVSKRDQESYGKRKAVEVKEAAVSQLATCLKVPVHALKDPSKSACLDCDDLHKLTEELKNKFTLTRSMQKKLSLLTLVPQSWTIEKTASEFSASVYMVRKARAMKRDFGVLPDQSFTKKGKELSKATAEKVTALYESDEFSRMCAGKKEYVSVKVDGVKIQKQKRLLLVNLKEMYEHFRKDNPESKIGFSKFCDLRPRWCITVGSRSSHSVCVCEIHQNVKLLVSALHNVGIQNISYEDLMSTMVCNISSRNCMIHQCENCPGITNLINHLTELLKQANVDDDDEINFKQWDHSDRGCNLVTRTGTADIFIDELSQQMENLTVHHFIAKSQASYLAACKSKLTPDTAIVLLDFAENYSFIVQDAIQGHHWDNSQATLHPFAVYHMKDNAVECMSICVISDCLQHDTITVHVFLFTVLNYLKQVISNLKCVKYFSDGAASQYKNYKNFVNLVHHYEDFQLEAEWHFFATSHGKSPCDGIGGTVKRLAARASLQAVTTNHILTPEQLFTWSQTNIIGIKFFYISKAEIDIHAKDQEKRFATAKTIPGTRSHHCFVPTPGGQLKMFRISADTEGTVSDITPADCVGDYVPGKYVAAVYDQAWYAGNIIERDDDKRDVLVNFMAHREAAFQWPRKKDECWVPFEHILCLLPVPSITSTGRHYYFPEDIMIKTEELFKKFARRYF